MTDALDSNTNPDWASGLSDPRHKLLRNEIRQRLEEALLRSGDALSDPDLSGLPGSIRLRVKGALAAWHAMRKTVDGVLSPTLTEMLKSFGILNLSRYFDRFTRDLLPYGFDGRPAEQLSSVAQYTSIWLAFDIRGGMFYEPTPPLHRLLDAAYIADDVPIGMLKLPVDTLCIIPEPSLWKRAGDVEAITVLRNAQSISFVAWIKGHGGNGGMDAITLPLINPDETIHTLIDRLLQTGPQSAQPDDVDVGQFWRRTLDYAIKMLLYLNARDASVVHDRAYSTAPRLFTGLGKRKRTQRLAEIEQLYDRHLVGPAILDSGIAESVPAEGAHHEVRGHWRRPHFRMQPHGPQASLRKLIFVGPTIVRADRLGLH
ncbi:hypothetical protein PQR14_36550 [Paraburkholderia bryophila]|uniref:hypothetical protein n=1 Tax=Paraburkholderia bryophila TaxID=420952 RepID=UPI0038BA4174